MTKRLPATAAPRPLEEFAVHFDDLFPRRSQREGCVRNGTPGLGDGCRGQRETGPDDDQAAASSAMMAAQRSWNRRRRSDSATRSSDRAWARKYWRCSSKPTQQRAAEAQAPNPRIG